LLFRFGFFENGFCGIADVACVAERFGENAPFLEK
jgi:hypothetical protein